MEDILFFFTTVLLGSFAIVLIFWFFFHHNTFWKHKNIPVVRQNCFQDLFRPVNKTIQDLQIERNTELGRIYGYYEKNCPVLSVAEPDLLKLILMKDFKYFSSRRNEDTLDEMSARMLNHATFKRWRRIRLIVSPTFSTSKLKKLMRLMTNCSTTLINNFDILRCKEHFLDVTRIFHAFSLDVLVRIAFSTKIDTQNDPNNQFVRTCGKLFAPLSPLKLILFNISEFIFGKWSCKLFSITSELKFLESVAKQIIIQRRETGKIENDFLQLLMDASIENIKSKDDFKDMSEIFGEKIGALSGNINKVLSLDEITAQSVLFFISSYHSTSASLSFATYLLALHQDIQDKVYQEIKSTLGENLDTPTYEDLQKMKYLDNVIAETLRLYPPIPNLDRVTVMDYNLSSIGVSLPKGIKIRIPLFALHRDPKFFPEPTIFNPDRFHEDNREKLVPYSYLPFGAGPRNCVAMRLALLNVKNALVQLLCKFHIQPCPETKVPLEFHTGRHIQIFFNLLPKDIMVKMIPRQK